MKKISIKKLLVPIDFSNNSMNALQAAAAIAKRHDAMVHLLHVVDNDYDLYKKDLRLEPPKLGRFMKKLAELARSVVDHDNIICNYSTEYGSVTHQILSAAIEFNASMIIMGKNGTNGPSKEFAGTQTCQVAEKARIPVIIVPDNVTKYSFENILYPMRPLLSAPEKYDAIRSFILKSKPEIFVLNLRNPLYNDELHIIDRLSLIMKQKLAEDKVPHKMEFYFKDSCFAEKVIEVMAEESNKFDLAVITAELDRMNQDFHLGFYVQKVIHQCLIPLMILHPETAKPAKAIVLDTLGIRNEMVL